MRVIYNQESGEKPIKVWASILEQEAENQLRNMAKLPFIHSHVAVMPDAHAGKGSTVGTVIATRGAIIPAAVGVDIGCGMAAVKLPITIEQLGGDGGLRQLRSNIERAVPVGHRGHSKISQEARLRLSALFGVAIDRGVDISEKVMHEKAMPQLGTLGGGNHFIEVCHDLEGGAWLMLHSGSRYIGKTLAEKHINKAKSIMKDYFISLPDPDLAYFAQGTSEFKAYLTDLLWAQEYAKMNRDMMVDLVIAQIYRHVAKDEFNWFSTWMDLRRIDCHHNYTSIENFGGKNVYITRKGAVSAKAGEWGIIPGSMGTKSYIVRGKGNENSFNSCSHGAGRVMSRTKARAVFTSEDLHAQTFGVECRKDNDVIDEIPGAYKDIDQVMADQADLVEIVHELKQVLCVKG